MFIIIPLFNQLKHSGNYVYHLFKCSKPLQFAYTMYLAYVFYTISKINSDFSLNGIKQLSS
jgi:hypothetical protein